MKINLKKLPIVHSIFGLMTKPQALKHYPRFKNERKKWIKNGGKITRNFMILNDYDDFSGKSKRHYFHQDLLVAGFVHQQNPIRHIDVGSRIDGFVAHVASFREIEVVDIRPLPPSEHPNIKFLQADLMNPQDLEQTDSLSCLHAIEHFGLGRYGDPIDVDGHNKGITNFVNLVKKGGHLYISFPIGQADEVHFNAHRVFHVKTILNHPDIREKMELVRFDYIDDRADNFMEGDLHMNASVDNFDEKVTYGCGIYTFVKTDISDKK